MKWGLVIAGISDLARPAEKLSLTQNGALTATGIIWTRWCLIIKPKNYLYVHSPFTLPQLCVVGADQLTDYLCSLAAVNFFLGVVGVIQCTRIGLYHQSQKALESKPEEAKEAVAKS